MPYKLISNQIGGADICQILILIAVVVVVYYLFVQSQPAVSSESDKKKKVEKYSSHYDVAVSEPAFTSDEESNRKNRPAVDIKYPGVPYYHIPSRLTSENTYSSPAETEKSEARSRDAVTKTYILERTTDASDAVLGRKNMDSDFGIVVEKPRIYRKFVNSPVVYSPPFDTTAVTSVITDTPVSSTTGRSYSSSVSSVSTSKSASSGSTSSGSSSKSSSVSASYTASPPSYISTAPSSGKAPGPMSSTRTPSNETITSTPALKVVTSPLSVPKSVTPTQPTSIASSVIPSSSASPSVSSVPVTTSSVASTSSKPSVPVTTSSVASSSSKPSVPVTTSVASSSAAPKKIEKFTDVNKLYSAQDGYDLKTPLSKSLCSQKCCGYYWKENMDGMFKRNDTVKWGDVGVGKKYRTSNVTCMGDGVAPPGCRCYTGEQQDLLSTRGGNGSKYY